MKCFKDKKIVRGEASRKSISKSRSTSGQEKEVNWENSEKKWHVGELTALGCTKSYWGRGGGEEGKENEKDLRRLKESKCSTMSPPKSGGIIYGRGPEHGKRKREELQDQGGFLEVQGKKREGMQGRGTTGEDREGGSAGTGRKMGGARRYLVAAKERGNKKNRTGNAMDENPPDKKETRKRNE